MSGERSLEALFHAWINECPNCDPVMLIRLKAALSASAEGDRSPEEIAEMIHQITGETPTVQADELTKMRNDHVATARMLDRLVVLRGGKRHPYFAIWDTLAGLGLGVGIIGKSVPR